MTVHDFNSREQSPVAILRRESVALAARLAPSTIDDQRREINRLRDHSDDVNETLMQTVVTLADGKHHTLHALFEDSWTEAFTLSRPLCQVHGSDCLATDRKACV